MADTHAIHRRIDATVEALAGNLKLLLYDNTVVPVLQSWLGSSASIAKLESDMERAVAGKEPLVRERIDAAFRELTADLATALVEADRRDTPLDLTEIQDELGEQVANIVASVSALALVIVSGGSGVSLVAAGPAGWVVGGVIAAVAVFFGKETLNDVVSEMIHDKPLPKFFKRSLKSKIAADLKLREPMFEKELRDGIRKRCQPLYDSADAKAS